MKRFKYFLRTISTGIFLFLTLCPSLAQKTEITAAASRADSLQISLLTCGPGQEAYSIYGHTAIRVKNLATGDDIVVNYGVFDMSKSHFVLRFIFGLTDYTIVITDFSHFCAEYAYDKRWVKEQPLNLTPSEKLRIEEALMENYRPENRVYRYNIFYDNCTTRARDMIVENLDGKVAYPSTMLATPYRELIYQYSYRHPWTKFGNDLLLGVKADAPTTDEQRQFLPEYLMRDFEEVAVIGENGERRQLCDTTYTIVQVEPSRVEIDRWNSPKTLLLVLQFIILAIIVAELFLKKWWFWWFDALLMLVLGVCGLILTAMIFSQHPTVSLNLQILFLNPLALVGVYAALKRNPKHWFWAFYVV
ncbi:MAG: DUF4105 domain-containing protein, partial [Prevotella sp.]|nr:DUF4105 domain-containing protein [Prevotella sp.]